eukprot:TRINITY_DN2005_c0_g5_i4.p1 TRINITY_DN2005_c0_g5~~TRINITY_DN2005_c0_g5_i4.p1  ORF type:complete len:499 (+),score=108.46 TRINITY_DN2005_c0_g5_i4:81-1577(+)
MGGSSSRVCSFGPSPPANDPEFSHHTPTESPDHHPTPAYKPKVLDRSDSDDDEREPEPNKKASPPLAPPALDNLSVGKRVGDVKASPRKHEKEKESEEKKEQAAAAAAAAKKKEEEEEDDDDEEEKKKENGTPKMVGEGEDNEGFRRTDEEESDVLQRRRARVSDLDVQPASPALLRHRTQELSGEQRKFRDWLRSQQIPEVSIEMSLNDGIDSLDALLHFSANELNEWFSLIKLNSIQRLRLREQLRLLRASSAPLLTDLAASGVVPDAKGDDDLDDIPMPQWQVLPEGHSVRHGAQAEVVDYTDPKTRLELKQLCSVDYYMGEIVFKRYDVEKSAPLTDWKRRHVFIQHGVLRLERSAGCDVFRVCKDYDWVALKFASIHPSDEKPWHATLTGASTATQSHKAEGKDAKDGEEEDIPLSRKDRAMDDVGLDLAKKAMCALLIAPAVPPGSKRKFALLLSIPSRTEFELWQTMLRQHHAYLELFPDNAVAPASSRFT